MQLIQACTHILRQLEDVVHQLSEKEFSQPCPALSQSTIGQHLRHTLEFFMCLQAGFDQGVVNYDRRPHDKLIESDKFIALSAMAAIRDFIESQREDKHLQLEVGYERNSEDWVVVATNYFRELTYNIEHAVHHMAIMKIGIREVAPGVNLPEGFGVAVSTLRHQEQAQHTH